MLPLAVRRLELVVLMLKEKKTEKEREIHVQSNGNLGDRGKWPWWVGRGVIRQVFLGE